MQTYACTVLSAKGGVSAGLTVILLTFTSPKGAQCPFRSRDSCFLCGGAEVTGPESLKGCIHASSFLFRR
jgi:hypothetical protein